MAPDALLSAFRRQLEARPGTRRWLIGFSGGLDSRVLVELAARCLDPTRILLLHVNHHLQAEADSWAVRCRRTAAALGLGIRVLNVAPASASEADAREARYRAFEGELQTGDCLLLGHHADDQAETLLLRLLRGAGVRGLKGMPRSRRLGAGRLLRPLLDIKRADLQSWARQQGLEWIEDPSNAGLDYDRNFLRHRVLPPLAERWPDCARRLAHSSGHLDEAAGLLAEVAGDDLAACRRPRGGLGIEALATLSKARRNNLLRHWVETATGISLNARLLASIEQDLLPAAADRQPRIALGDWSLRRYRGELYLLPPPALTDAGTLGGLKLVPSEMQLAQGRLLIRPARPGETALQSLEGLTLRYRRDGERCRPAGRGGAHPLKKLFQEYAVPPWLRDSWPLLVGDDEIVAVPGLFVCEGWQSAPGESGGYWVEWEPGPSWRPTTT